MKIMSCKKCFKNAKTGNVNKNDLSINKILCIHLPKYYIHAPETDTFALFKVSSSQRGFLGVNLIKKRSKKCFLSDQFFLKQSRIYSTNGYSFF